MEDYSDFKKNKEFLPWQCVKNPTAEAQVPVEVWVWASIWHSGLKDLT